MENWGLVKFKDAMMSLLRLFSTEVCILLSLYTYTKCLGNLRCRGQGPGCSLTLLYRGEGGPQIYKNWGLVKSKDAIMSLLRLFSTAVCIPLLQLYIHKVFEHLQMLWIRSWVHPYTVTLVKVGPRFRKICVRLCENVAMMSLLRPFGPTVCIPLLHCTYIKCLGTLRCCG